MLTRSNRSVMSWLYIRMQPYETYPPIDPGLLVPWMAYWPPDKVSAAAPIGFFGEPPGMMSGIPGCSRLMSGGGPHAGLMRLLSIIDLPAHWRPARPTPTGYERARPSPSTR